MTLDTLDTFLHDLDDHPAIPVMCTAIDTVSGRVCEGVRHLAPAKLQADEGARRIVRKFLAEGAPIQYGTSIAKNVYGLPPLAALRYAARIANDSRASYGPVSKALGMEEVLGWAMQAADQQIEAISKGIYEDDFFIQHGGKKEQRTVNRDDTTGRFARRGGSGMTGYFAQVARRRSDAPSASAGAGMHGQDPEESRRQTAAAEAEAEAVEQEAAVDPEEAELMERRAKRAALYQKFQRHKSLQGAAAKGRAAQAEFESGISEYEQQQKEMARYASSLRTSAGLDRNLDEIRTKGLVSAKQQAEEKAATAEKQRYRDLVVYDPEQPLRTSVKVDFTETPWMKGVSVLAPMLASYGYGNQPSETEVISLFTGATEAQVAAATPAQRKELRKKVEEVHQIALAFIAMEAERDQAFALKRKGGSQDLVFDPVGWSQSYGAASKDSEHVRAQRQAAQQINFAINNGMDYTESALNDMGALGRWSDPTSMDWFINKPVNGDTVASISNVIANEISRRIQLLSTNTAKDTNKYVTRNTTSITMAEMLAQARDLTMSYAMADGAGPEEAERAEAIDRVARGYAIFGTAYAPTGGAALMVFQPSYIPKVQVVIHGSDSENNNIQRTFAVQDVKQLPDLAETIEDRLTNNFNRGRIESVEIKEQLSHTGYSTRTMSPLSQSDVPDLLDGPNVLPLARGVLAFGNDPRFAMGLLQDMGKAPLLPRQFGEHFGQDNHDQLKGMGSQESNVNRMEGLKQQIEALRAIKASRGYQS